MAQIAGLIVAGFVLISLHSVNGQASFTQCSQIRDCIEVYVRDCFNGQRRICYLLRSDTVGCPTAAVTAGSSLMACQQNTNDILTIATGAEVCSDPLTPGQNYSIGISNNAVTNPQSDNDFMFINNQALDATCGFNRPFCSFTSSTDAVLSVVVPSCPATTTTTTPTTPTTATTTMPAGCSCPNAWGQWSPASCPTQCGVTTTRFRSRTCTGTGCTSDQTGQTETCPVITCPVNGNWGTWGSFSTCSRSCGGGQWSRTRLCNNPAPSNGGSDCPGSSIDQQLCNTQNCPSPTPGPGPSPGPGGRGCRRRAKNNACRGLRRRARRRCIRRECGRRG